MKIPSLRSIETILRVVPVVKDLLPSNKDGLNSLIDAPAYKIRKLEDALTDKKAEICKLREDKKAMQEKIKELEDRVNDILHDLDKVLLEMENK